MKLGIVGLGRMGGNIALRLMDRGHECAVWDRDAKAVTAAAQAGAVRASSLADLVKKLPAPRAVWVMLPAGQATDDTVAELGKLLSKGDIIIDGGNTLYKDDIRRASELAARGIEYVDIGTSGGVWGRERGYCLMVGGEKKAVKQLEPVLSALAPGAGDIPRTVGRSGKASSAELGWLHCGPAGAGHFVKMIHNGIEYGMMQAYAEGFDILKGRANKDLPPAARYDLDLGEIAELWRRGSVVTSWLLDLTAAALAQDSELSDFSGAVADSGEGRWTIEAAVEEAVPAPVLAASLFARFRSRREGGFADRMLSAMRRGFGGHAEKSKKRA